MTLEEIILAIAHPDNKYWTNHGQTQDKKDYLRVKMIEVRKAAERIFNQLNQEKDGRNHIP